MQRMIKWACVWSFIVLLLACGPQQNQMTQRRAPAFQPEILPLPPELERYEPMPIPADNPMTPEKVALGRQLFFDKRLSADGSRSCYSCHLCENGLSIAQPKPIGALNKPLTRNSPVLWNIGYHKEFYWDGRSPSLEKQALAAWKGANMGAEATLDQIVARINAIEGYRTQFQAVFNGPATPDNIVQALAAFQRTIFSGNTAFDRWQAGDESAVSEQVKRGWQIFDKKAKCTNCHSGVLFTDLQYHNVGIGMDQPEPDVGRFKVTNKPEDTGAFKTPTLRDVAESGPYFHDGSVATLEEAVDIMVGGGKPNRYLDRKNLQPAKLTPAEKQDLIAFLKSLSTDCPPLLKEPPLPPE